MNPANGAAYEPRRRLKRLTAETLPPVAYSETKVVDECLQQLIRDAVRLEFREHVIENAIRLELARQLRPMGWCAAAILVSILALVGAILGAR